MAIVVQKQRSCHDNYFKLTIELETRLRKRAAWVGLTPEEYGKRALVPKRRKITAGALNGEQSCEGSGTLRFSTGGSLLKFARTRVGDNSEVCLADVDSTRFSAKF